MQRLSRLTDDILDIAKIEIKSLELRKQRFNLKDIVINAMDDIILSKDLSVQLLYESQNIILEEDKGRISQVLSNLLSNAIKFTTQGTTS